MKNKIVRFSKSILTILIGIFLGLLILELFLRGLGYYQNNWTKFSITKTKQQDELRILALGESMTNSGVAPYPGQLQEILSNNPKINKKINVINGGVGGTSSKDIVQNLESYLDQYNPDIVVVMTGINNDQKVDYDQWANIYKEDKLNNIKTIKLFKYLYQNYKNKISRIVKNINISYVYANETNVDDILNRLEKEYSKYSIDENGSETQIEKELFRKLNNSSYYKDQTYMEFSDYYASVLKNEKQIVSALKALSVNKNNAFAYSKLSDNSTQILTFEEREKLLLKALEVNPYGYFIYAQLGRLYGDNGNVSLLYKNNINKEKELNAYLKGIEYNPSSTELWFWLGKYYYWYNNFPESEKALNKAISLNNIDNANRSADIYQILAKIYQKQNRTEEANKVLGLAIESSDVLTNNYPIIAEILKKRGIALIAMQYPLRDINILKNILKDYDVSYVDNNESFRIAVEKYGNNNIFVDLFAGDFGHCTPEGNRIMAENVESEILKYLNLEK